MAVRLSGRLRRLCRGSGRVLALVVAASVLWLLFDMAALRVSFAGSEYSKPEKRILGDRDALGERTRRHPRFGFLRAAGGAASTRAAPGPGADDPRPNLVDKRFGRRRGAPDPAKGNASRPREPPAAAKVDKRRFVVGQRAGANENAAGRPGVGAAGPAAGPGPGSPLPDADAKAAEVRAAGARSAPPVETARPEEPRGAPIPRAAAAVDARRGEAPANATSPVAAGHEADGGRPERVANGAAKETKPAGEIADGGGVGGSRIGRTTSKVIIDALGDGGVKSRDVSKAHGVANKSADAAGVLTANRTQDAGVARGLSATAKLSAKMKIATPPLARWTRQTNEAVERSLTAPPRRRNDSRLPELNRASRDAASPGRAATGPLHRVHAASANGTGRAAVAEGPRHRLLALDATLSPRDPHAPGQFGYGVTVRPEDQELADRRWREGAFNVFVSDQIPLDRALPDTRPPACADQTVPDALPLVSVIICFIDEAWSTLLRSVHSVLNRSPPGLLRELILVDDFSTKEHLKEKLDKYLANFPKVRLLRLTERHGLIRARLVGSAVSTGDILLFLDSHVECNVGWLEPLVARIHANRSRVACPVIEVINEKDMSYQHVTDFLRGVFEWPLNFGWRATPVDVVTALGLKREDPFPCPVMAGGLFAIDKRYFYELGTYDPGLEVWGGENLELSFKVWMCGGEIEIVPCSRVGHVYRADNPYPFPGGDKVSTVQRNLRRVADVWLDEYAEVFYGRGYGNALRSRGAGGGVLPEGEFAARFVRSSVGDVEPQRRLRQALGCRSFGWYLENVYADLRAPLVQADGWVWNEGSNQCLTVINNSIEVHLCIQTGGVSKPQQFNYTWWQQLRQDGLCLAALAGAGTVGLAGCRPASEPQAWLHSHSEQPLAKHIVKASVRESLCLAQVGKGLKLSSCDVLNAYQKWNFGRYFE
ncbi:polypeptide N-acetylgalactosaminyltransferase 5-like [Petromyzon marinus]|uniref:polypeptide N-acetylgalactosaminyltransferase 5-like n=1 Tax=Petromyzon marinus TaxID=7757 RepID=UPI003F6F7370